MTKKENGQETPKNETPDWMRPEAVLDAMKGWMDPSRFTEAMKDWTQPGRFMDSVKAWTDPKGYGEMFKNWADPSTMMAFMGEIKQSWNPLDMGDSVVRKWLPSLLVTSMKSPLEAMRQMIQMRMAWLTIAQESVDQAFALRRRLMEQELAFLDRLKGQEKAGVETDQATEGATRVKETSRPAETEETEK